jgi:prophage regulatory protein
LSVQAFDYQRVTWLRLSKQGATMRNKSTSDLPDRIIGSAERRRLVPFSDMHIWRLEKAGQFPQRIKIGAQRVGWSLSEISAWINARKARRGC